MPYIAKHYVTVNGEMYMAGEKIPDDLPKEKIEWYLKAGAICKAAPIDAPDSGNTATEPPNTEGAEDTDVEPQDVPEGENNAEEPDSETDDGPAPEIDVMAGIVQGGQDKPQKKPTRAKATATARKKTTKGEKAK